MKKWRFHELDAFHLNVGVPIVITLFLLIINFEFFTIVFVEKMRVIFQFYFYIIFSVLIIRLLLTKKQKTKKKVLKLSIYEFGVVSSLIILVFLILNLSCSNAVYNNKFPINYQLVNKPETLNLKEEYSKTILLNQDEYDKYYKKGYRINIQINKSCFGLEFLKSRTFEKI